MELLIDNVLNIGADEFYRSNRYKVPLSVMLINTSDNDAFNLLDRITRQTDIVQQLTSELLVVFLSHTDYDNALLFIYNLGKELDFTYTISQFQGQEFEFIQNLFVQNSLKCENPY